MRKVLSTLIVLTMVFSLFIGTATMETANAAEESVKTININFDDYETDVNLADDGVNKTGAIISAPKTDAVINVTKNSYQVQSSKLIIKENGTLQSGAPNKVMQFVPFVSKAYVTEEEKALMTKEVELAAGGTIMAFESTCYGADGLTTYVTYNKSNNVKMWYEKDPTTGKAVVARKDAWGADTTYWFTPDGIPALTGGSASNITLPNESGAVDAEGNYIGTYSASYKLYRPRTEAEAGDNGHNLILNNCFGTKYYQVYIGKNKIWGNGTTTNEDVRVYTNPDDKSVYSTLFGVTASYVGKTEETTGIFTNKDNLISIGSTSGAWHEIKVTFFFDENVIRMYYDGKPLFFQVANKELYSSEIYYAQNGASFPTVRINESRLNYYAGNNTMIDDIKITYDTSRLENALSWEDISNGQSEAGVYTDLNLVNSITYKGENYPVTWTSSNTEAISSAGKVVRAEDHTTAILTAAFGGVEVKFNVTVAGTNGKRTIYLAGDSLVCEYPDASWPQQGWGHYLKEYFNDDVSVVNVAQGGRSAKSFYRLLFENKIESKLVPGDYVFISFATNDDIRTNTYEYIDENGVKQTDIEGSSIPEFAEFLQKYVDDIRAKGAIPVFVTSANHGSTLYTHETYVQKMRDVANANNAPIIDLSKIQNDYIKTIKALPSTPEAERTGNGVPESVKVDLHMYKYRILGNDR